MSQATSRKSSALFGQPLSALLSISYFSETTGLPDIFRKFTTYLKTKVNVEEIFADDSIDVETLKGILEIAPESIEFDLENPLTIAQLFKVFIKELPKPLIKNDALTEFLISEDLSQERLFYQVRDHLLEVIPLHFKALKEIFGLLVSVASSPASKMNIERLASVWTPVLFPKIINGTSSEVESAKKFVAKIIEWTPLIFSDLEVVLQDHGEKIIKRQYDRKELVEIWAAKLKEERQSGLTVMANAIGSTTAFRHFIQSLCSKPLSSDEDKQYVLLLLSCVLDLDSSGSEDDLEIASTVFDSTQEFCRMAVSSEIIESFCFLLSTLTKDFSTQTLQTQERNINMFHAMLSERKILEPFLLTPRKSSIPPPYTGAGSANETVAPASNNSSPRVNKTSETQPSSLNRASSLPQLAPLAPGTSIPVNQHPSPSQHPSQPVFRSGWVFTPATTGSTGTQFTPPPIVIPSGSPGQFKRPARPSPAKTKVMTIGNRTSPTAPRRDPSTTSDSAPTKTLQETKAPTSAEVNEDEEYEYEEVEVYEETEEWEYVEPDPTTKASPKKSTESTTPATATKQPRSLSGSSDGKEASVNDSATSPSPSTSPVTSTLAPSPTLSSPIEDKRGSTENKRSSTPRITTPEKSVTIEDLSSLASKLERWSKLIDLYLQQQTLLTQQTKLKDVIYEKLPEHVKMFTGFLELFQKTSNSQPAPKVPETKPTEEEEEEEEEEDAPLPKANKPISQMDLQSLMLEKEMLQKRLKLVSKQIDKVVAGLREMHFSAIASVRKILETAKGGFETMYFSLKESERLNENRCLDDSKEMLEFLSSTLNATKALENSTLSKEQLEEKSSVLRKCYLSRLSLKKAMETFRVKERLAEQEQITYQLQTLVNLENEIKKGLEDSGAQVFLDEVEKKSGLSAAGYQMMKQTAGRPASYAGPSLTSGSAPTSRATPTLQIPLSNRGAKEDPGSSSPTSPKTERKKDRSARQTLSKIASIRISSDKVPKNKDKDKDKDKGSVIPRDTPKSRPQATIARYSIAGDEGDALAIAKDQLYESLISWSSNETPEEREKRLRSEVVSEIIATETAYLKNLQAAIKYILEPLKTNGVITKEEHSVVFGNLDSLLAPAQKLLRNLQGQEDLPLEEQSIGQCFLCMAPELAVYKDYCANQGRSQKLRDKLVKRPQFAAFVAEATKSSEFNAEQTGLDSLLIQPMQRICRYPLLLGELAKRCPENHLDKVDSMRALEEISKIVDEINILRADDDKVSKLEDLLESFVVKDPKLSLEGLAIATRELLMEGLVKKLKSKGYSGKGNIYLFNDMIILTVPGKKPEVKFVVLAKKCCISDVRDSGKVRNTFEMLNTATKDLAYLSFNTEQEKKAWMQNINSIVNHSLAESAINLVPIPK